MIFVAFSILLVSHVSCYGRTPYRNELCEASTVASCAFQIPSNDKRSCLVYNTAACQTFDLMSWSNDDHRYPAQESLSSFEISLEPYAKPLLTRYFLPALNVSFTPKRPGISGYVLNLLEIPKGRNICRIFDYRKASKQNVSLFYDCLVVQLAVNGQHYFLSVRALPINEELKYQVFVPDSLETNADTICQWKPLILLYTHSLEENVVQVKFSKAPGKFKVTEYVVALHNIASNSDDTIVVSVKDTSSQQMLQASFPRVDIGTYYVNIRPLKGDVPCSGASTINFTISTKLVYWKLIFYLSLICVIVIILAVVVYRKVRWGKIPVYFGSRRKVLIVYSYDRKHHHDVVTAWSKVLERIGCNVTSIYFDGKCDPTEWLYKNYNEAHIIVIVISRSVYLKIAENNQPKCDEMHKWGDRLTPTISVLEKEVVKPSHGKKFAKVYFEYSGPSDVPEKMRFGIWGKTFALPKQMDDFISYIHQKESSTTRCPSACFQIQTPDCSAIPEMEPLKRSIAIAKQSTESKPNKVAFGFNMTLSSSKADLQPKDINLELEHELSMALLGDTQEQGPWTTPRSEDSKGLGLKNDLNTGTDETNIGSSDSPTIEKSLWEKYFEDEPFNA